MFLSHSSYLESASLVCLAVLVRQERPLPSVLVAAFSLLLGCGVPRDQRLLGGPIDVNDVPQVIPLKPPILAKLPVSEILFGTRFDLKEMAAKHTDPLRISEEAGLEVSLIRENGQKMPLKNSFMNQYVSAGSDSLIGIQTPQGPFVGLRIASKKPMHFENVIWLSCDNRQTKDGTCFEVFRPPG